MPASTPRSQLKKLIKADYGQWKLVQLPSGRWASMWGACLDVEDMCQSILREDPEWFHEEPLFEGHPPNPSYASKEEALKTIISALENDVAEHPKYEYFTLHLQSALRALRRTRIG